MKDYVSDTTMSSPSTKVPPSPLIGGHRCQIKQGFQTSSLKRMAAMAISAVAAPLAVAQGTSDTPSPRETRTVHLELPAVSIIGSRLQEQRQPGSVSMLDEEALEKSRPFTVNEAVRKLPGLHARDEEGFGLRPNIGMRGLNPTRSTKVTLLEDGVPLAYAPYGDNASYYFPPIDRFTSVELVKGAGSLAYGPQTIGGVLNFRTPAPSRSLKGFAQVVGGSRDFMDAKVQASANGWLFDATRKIGLGARDNTKSELNDLNAKAHLDLGGGHGVTAKLSHFTEDSTVTYSGLTLAEFNRLGARYNPFKNDQFEISRTGASLTHRWTLGGGRTLTTQLYAASFARDWWRQSSTTTDSQCGAAFVSARLAGTAVDVDSCNSTQGRLRSYQTVGIDSRFSTGYTMGGLYNLLDIGVKIHDEHQARRQVNAAAPTGRVGTLAEDNLRDTRAYSAFISNRVEINENIAITPVLRFESIRNQRHNRLTAQIGSDTLSQLIPGVGASWKFSPQSTLFASVHRGFAPPRTEDVIAGNGTSTEVGAERSLNSELGIRTETLNGLNVQATAFRNDFDRLIAVGSIAGGNTPLAQGRALFEGVEVSGSWYPQDRLLQGWFSNFALTWLSKAQQTEAFSQVVGGSVIAGSAAGNRQPYAPERLSTASVGFDAGRWMVQLEGVHTSAQFTDFANTVTASANGQTGLIDAHTVFNLAADWQLNRQWMIFATAKNLTDKLYVVDRTRGIQVGQPRLAQVGLRTRF